MAFDRTLMVSLVIVHGLSSLTSNVLMQALDIVPAKIHERSPIFLGSYDDVEEIKALYATEEEKN